MDELFAPWRIDWVRRDPPEADAEDCVFCSFAESGDDRDHLVVARTDGAYVLLNNHPYNPGHAMVVPHVHTGRFPELEGSTLHEMERLTQLTIEALEAAFAPDGYNTGCNLGSAAAGGSIGEHVHRHIVPRWSGDTNFMPVLGETKVIVQALEETYDELHGAFAALSEAEAEDGAVELSI